MKRNDTEKEQEKKVCLRFASGKYCRYEENCWYKHQKISPATREKKVKENQNTKVCLWYATGKVCRFGDECKFEHKKMCSSIIEKKGM